ncbi:ABC transporter six-transmembrane domain-containing protein [Vibrio rhodolitus]|uniref:ABC transporter six-transmembrane domain-containing protein n=1 Tax=Vibrio rhodolitus TaxID=2231649 RepID=UPI001FCA2BEB|nr:ABC transporter six-transmembrane domain-containing protein [Vibrio rhodolitus]
MNRPINLRTVVRISPVKVAITWLMVLAENLLMILLPLFIGFAIDGVLSNNLQPLFVFALIMFALVVIAVVRRFYDTRVYGGIRVRLAKRVERNLRGASVSVKDARLTMSRELVDFLEDDLPNLFTSIIQLVAAVVILATFHIKLALCVLSAGLVMLLVYFGFHRVFAQLNGKLNDQLELQVHVLSGQPFPAIALHFERLKRCEIKLSDTEALVYGLIFLILFAAILTNLWMVGSLIDPTVGQVFSIVTYSLEFVESAVMLPLTLQTLARLTEISQRLNRQDVQMDIKESVHEA